MPTAATPGLRVMRGAANPSTSSQQHPLSQQQLAARQWADGHWGQRWGCPPRGEVRPQPAARGVGEGSHRWWKGRRR
jgi:hypothetical protein